MKSFLEKVDRETCPRTRAYIARELYRQLTWAMKPPTNLDKHRSIRAHVGATRAPDFSLRRTDPDKRVAIMPARGPIRRPRVNNNFGAMRCTRSVMGEDNSGQVPAPGTTTDRATQAPTSFARLTARSSASTWVAVWVAVRSRSAQFTGVRTPSLTCGVNAHEPL